MRARAAKDLGQLSDRDFLKAVSQGLSLIIDNATRLHVAAQVLLKAKHMQGVEILTSLTEEEAAKFLILIDAVRCPPNSRKIRSRQLGYFSEHLARGIYVRLSNAQPTDLAELKGYADMERVKLYLDGPNDVDWIFRNSILAQREEAMYVDYVEVDGGHEWLVPRNAEPLPWLSPQAYTLKICQALHKTGMTTPSGLAVVAKIWRPVNVCPELRWDEVVAKNRETLKELERTGLLTSERGDAYATVVERWPFPLYTLDLHAKEVDRNKLRKEQQQWSTDQPY